ncbi:MAG: formate/nitrite transporter family protein [Bdellovibrionota bacterium]
MEKTDPNILTSRAKERRKEEDRFVPVIVKRNDEIVKHPDDTLEQAIREGENQLERHGLSLFLSAISAGLIISFCAVSVSFGHALVQGLEQDFLTKFAMALFYPIGFIICIMSGTQLFTEHTALAVYPCLDKRHHIDKLFRLWSIVLAGNLIGTGIGALFMNFSVPVTGTQESYIAIGKHLLDFPWWTIFLSGILAGWLMALGSWLVHSTPTSFSQIVCIYLVTFMIGIGGFHHCIAGSAEIFIAKLLSPSIPFSDILKMLSAAIIGNLFGGSVFVAALNYAHIRKTQEL